MKEHGILFKPEMIQAILDGRKTMTRRVVKPQPDDDGLWNHTLHPMALESTLEGWWGTVDETGESKQFNCPYGNPNDLLYVKEAVSKIPDGGDSFGEWLYKRREDKPYGKWISPLFMPKAAASIWLEITDIKVERLQDISEEDAEKEGVQSTAVLTAEGDDYTGYYATEHFQKLWQSINGFASWNSNPFVWCITFKRIER